MKILVRILIILLAAIIVVGATYGVTQIPAVQTAMSSQGGEHHGPPAGTSEEITTVDGTLTFSDAEAESAEVAAATTGDTATSDTEAATATTSTQVRPQRGEGGGESGGNLAGLFEVAKNLVIVMIVSLAIAAVGFVAKRMRPQRRAQAAAV